MKEDRKTRENLLKSAKKEFLEKGYSASSLRRICKNAGVTTGALYFFFQDKEDLFSSIVAEPLQRLYEIIHKHYAEEMEEGCINDEGLTDINMDMNMTAVSEALNHLYQYKEEFNLLLMKAQGTKFENCLDEVIEITKEHNLKLANLLCKKKGKKELEPFTIHWISHVQIDMFTQVLRHGLSKEEALSYLQTATNFLLDGWRGLF